MKMLLAIVQDEDVRGLLDMLIQKGLRATKISSTGGFLRRGNSTVLTGVEDVRVTEVLDIIHAACRRREQPSGPIPVPQEGAEVSPTPHPSKVEVGGATVFFWDVEQYIRV